MYRASTHVEAFQKFLASKSFPLEKKDIWILLDLLGYDYKRYDHEAVFTVEESLKVTGHLFGGHTKNLFLRDRKKNYWLVTTLESTAIHLKSLSKILSAKGNLSFVREDVLWQKLGVRAGSVTPLALINSSVHYSAHRAEGKIQFVLDKKILAQEYINVHPLLNDATVSLVPSDFVDFISLCGYEVLSIDFASGVSE